MAFDYITAISEKTFSDEIKQSNIIDVPDEAKEIEIRAKRDNWTDYKKQSIIKLRLDLSLDGGLTWIEPFMGFGTSGGVLVKENLSPLEYSWARRPLIEGKNRKARVRLEVVKDVSLNTFIDVGFE